MSKCIAFRRATALAVGLAALLAPAVVSATPATSPAGTIRVPSDFYDLQTGGAGAFVLNADESSDGVLRRIDPRTNQVTAHWRLNSSAGDFAVSPTAVWVSMYYDNTVERINPSNGKVVATIAVGLQPQWIYVGFGSVWVSNHHGGSVTRISPRTNRVLATITAGAAHTFRDGPQDITSDGHDIFVGASNGHHPLTVINPKTDKVIRHPNTLSQFCSDIVATRGAVWSADPCTNTLYRLSTATGAATFSRSFGAGEVNSVTVFDGNVWVAYDAVVDPDTGVGSQGTVDELSPATGATEQSILVGGDASVVRSVEGQLWVVDDSNGRLRHLSIADGESQDAGLWY